MPRYGNTALAYDRATPTRTIDLDGRMHIASAPISVARVCDYRGDEIPGWRELGLDPSKLYALLRPADELQRAASTFNNLPVLGGEHVAVTADNPRPDLVCGSTGTDAAWDAPYLRVSIVLWTKDAIAGVESGRCRDLSAAYRYTPVMEPGTLGSARFDGRMTNIIGSHCAVVPEGRNGSAVSVVGDARLRMPSYAERFPSASRIIVSPY